MSRTGLIVKQNKCVFRVAKGKVTPQVFFSSECIMLVSNQIIFEKKNNCKTAVKTYPIFFNNFCMNLKPREPFSFLVCFIFLMENDVKVEKHS